MSIRLSPLADIRQEAISLWENADVRTPFAHPALVDAASAAFGMRAIAGLADGAGVIGVEKRRGPLRALALLAGVPYTSPVLTEWPREVETFQQSTPLDALSVDLAASFAQATLALPPDWPDARPFAWNGWSLQTRYTAVADLSGDPISRWSHGTRQPARRHAEQFEVREGPDEVEHAARLQVAAYARKGLTLRLDGGALRQLGEALVGLGLARAFGAYRDGVCEAAALFAVDRTQATYWLSGSELGPAMAVLFLHAMPALAARGVETLDLGGANVPGVAQFKRQLGGRLAPVVVARWVRPRWLRALHALRS